MFDTSLYTSRRKTIKSALKRGILVFPGNEESPMNYPANPYRFRQDSTFLYYFGLDEPNVNAIIDLDEDQEIIFGEDAGIDDIIWMGPQLSLVEKTKKVGVSKTDSTLKFYKYLESALKKGRTIHILPPYRAEHRLKLSHLLKVDEKGLMEKVSTDFIKAVVAQRSIKNELEINEIENAHAITYEMQIYAMQHAKAGVIEREIAGAIEGIALAMGSSISFPIILSVHGETLHNHHHNNRLQEGHLLINDCGAESALHYAADITRTIPVGGKFNSRQKDIYEIVLAAQETAIDSIKSGVRFLDIHLKAAQVIASGLKDLGLMKGDVEAAVHAGAHALFFPHGLGHMLGMDVHDMENLGENYVGYDESVRRSEQFGLAYLRLAKNLQPGFVLTVEPGIYFIPELIDLWRGQKKFSGFINYDRVESFIGFGGVRIEDDVLVTEIGHRVIGKPIPKSVADIQEMAAS